VSTDGPAITSLELESRTFPPSRDLAETAVAREDLYAQAAADHDGFWLGQATGLLDWETPPTVACDRSRAPFFTWFADGTLNASVNCLDRHLETAGDRVAFHWEGEPGDRRSVTYRELHREVCRFANGLRSLGVKRGDKVAIYLGMIPEVAAAMLACARIGAVHTLVFAGFSPDSLRDRILGCDCTVLITGDGSHRNGKVVALKDNADVALAQCPDVTSCIVVRRTGSEIAWTEGRDHWYHELIADQPDECAPEAMNAEDMLYILFTSGSTGKPKGIVHTTGGYLTGVAATHRWAFDVTDDDVYWCAADVGWVTGHSYIVYGPLANGTTSVMYEGAPGTPDKDRWWDICERYGVTILYCAPTAIRTFMKWGKEYPGRHDLGAIRILGSVGEPINPEAWMWYRDTIGAASAPVIDTWWQTETGQIMISPLPGITTLKPGSAGRPLPGVVADILDHNGNSVPLGEGGYLVIREPWPAMLRTLYGDDDRYVQTYWSEYEGVYLAGDGARRDTDGDFWLMGRIDDVMNVSGHRLSTTEIESALVDHPAVAEAAVVGRTDPTTGQAIAAFVTLKGDATGTDALIAELRKHVADKIGPIARPKSIVITDDLPKTRSGKIMRRLLRDISEKRDLGDVTTLSNAEVVSGIAALAASSGTDDGK
jgi:acetyl-CoA synthetase